ncbi:MAG: hypothetical protein H6936_02900 [Burkholderiales bacterium]|nr:hypothetical protein [Burkholderiales bacterium]
MPKSTTQSMGADKLTPWALPWYFATALQYLKRKQSFPTYYTLLHNTTVTLHLTKS